MSETLKEVWKKGRVQIRFAAKNSDEFEGIMLLDKLVRHDRDIPLLLSGELKTFIDANSVLVAVIPPAQKVIGFIIFEDIQYGSYVRRIIILPTLRNESIGTALLLLSMKYSKKSHFETIPALNSEGMERMFIRLGKDLRFEFVPQTKTSARVSIRAPASMDNDMIKSKIEEVLTKKYEWEKG